MTRHRRLPRTLVTLSVALAGGCSFLQPHADPTKYFVLTAETSKIPAEEPAGVLGVEHIDLPNYLERPELVTRLRSNELKISDVDRWGESLQDGFARALRHDLAVQLGAGHVVEPPFDTARPPAVIVDVEVRRFERIENGDVVLEAGWTLRDGKSGKSLATRESHLRNPVAGRDTQATVAALSRALTALSSDIADEVRTRR